MAKKKQQLTRRNNGAGILRFVTENIPVFIFTFFIIYILVSVLMYMNNGQTQIYQVTTGPLSRNETYTGLALREEVTISASINGYVNYYAREGSKINANGAVYSISPGLHDTGEASLTKQDMDRIRTQMSSFSNSFSSSNFNSVYGFKYQLEGSILQYASHHSDTDTGGAVILGAQTIFKSSTDGIILYSYDGYENKTYDTVTESDFNFNSYKERDLKTKKPVKVGDPIYTLVTNEQWDMVIPLTDKQAITLVGFSTIRVKFLKDGLTQSGDFEIIEKDGKKYGHLTFYKGLMRYASDRFLDVELVTNTQTGLKLPRSAMFTRDFYAVPSEFVYYNEEENTVGFVKLETSRGREAQVFYETNLYGYDKKQNDSDVEESNSDLVSMQGNSDLYYVDKTAFEPGTVLINPDNGRTYTVTTTKTLDGVYCMNKGYGVFVRVEIIQQNDEFAIVKDDTTFGLVRFDRVAYDCSRIHEEDVLY